MTFNWQVVGIFVVLCISLIGFLVSWFFSNRLRGEKWAKIAVVVSMFINAVFYITMAINYGGQPTVLAMLFMSIFFSVIFLEYYKKFNRLATAIIISMFACVMLFN